MSEPREFNIRNLIAGNTARFQRVTPTGAYYYVWVANDNSPLAHRQPMKMWEFPVPLADILSLGGVLQAGEPAEKLAPFIALAIERGTFKEAT